MVGLTYNFCHVTCLAHGLKFFYFCYSVTHDDLSLRISELFFDKYYFKPYSSGGI